MLRVGGLWGRVSARGWESEGDRDGGPTRGIMGAGEGWLQTKDGWVVMW